MQQRRGLHYCSAAAHPSGRCTIDPSAGGLGLLPLLSSLLLLVGVEVTDFKSGGSVGIASGGAAG